MANPLTPPHPRRRHRRQNPRRRLSVDPVRKGLCEVLKDTAIRGNHRAENNLKLLPIARHENGRQERTVVSAVSGAATETLTSRTQGGHQRNAPELGSRRLRSCAEQFHSRNVARRLRDLHHLGDDGISDARLSDREREEGELRGWRTPDRKGVRWISWTTSLPARSETSDPPTAATRVRHTRIGQAAIPLRHLLTSGHAATSSSEWGSASSAASAGASSGARSSGSSGGCSAAECSAKPHSIVGIRVLLSLRRRGLSLRPDADLLRLVADSELSWHSTWQLSSETGVFFPDRSHLLSQIDHFIGQPLNPADQTVTRLLRHFIPSHSDSLSPAASIVGEAATVSKAIGWLKSKGGCYGIGRAFAK